MGKDDEDHISLQIPHDNVFVDANIGLGVDDSVNHEIVEVDDSYKVLSNSIEGKVKEAFSSPYVRECSIFRIHEKYHKMNERAYSPDVVSIGPLHHGKPNLEAMEPVKLIYMHALLYRAAIVKQYGDQVTEKNKEAPITNIAEIVSVFSKRTTEAKLNNVEECNGSKRELEEESELAILRECAKFIESKEEEARNCYSEPINHIKSDEFVEMMIIDGFFIIELFCRTAELVEMDGYDPIFSKIGYFSSIKRDLLLVENQIPIFVLTGLLVVIGLMGRETESRLFINILTLNFFPIFMPKDEDVLKKYLERGGKNLLDFLANTLHPSPKAGKVVNIKDTYYEWKRSLLGKLYKKFRTRTPEIVRRIPMLDSIKVTSNATEMERSGVRFKKGSTKCSFLDIKFNSNSGELEIPPLIILDEILIKNLVAYEQCSDGKTAYMSSYAFFLDSLIDSAEDVQILRSKDIIKNYPGSDEDVANVFNKLGCDVMIRNYYYSDVCKRIYKYCRKDINVWRATLRRDYCNTPWATISFVAAFLLLILMGTIKMGLTAELVRGPHGRVH